MELSDPLRHAIPTSPSQGELERTIAVRSLRRSLTPLKKLGSGKRSGPPAHPGDHHANPSYRPFLLLFGLIATASEAADAVESAKPTDDQPNFIIVFTDDQGYNDLGCFGSETIRTPNIDRLAAEGRRYTGFYSACSVCSPSRAALLTGCYPKRVGMHRHVLFPQSDYGLNPSEYTIADHLKTQGYATACIGKWHLGHHPETLPTSNGFDSYFGIPYSNDMNHPNNQNKPKMSSTNFGRTRILV